MKKHIMNAAIIILLIAGAGCNNKNHNGSNNGYSNPPGQSGSDNPGENYNYGSDTGSMQDSGINHNRGR